MRRIHPWDPSTVPFGIAELVDLTRNNQRKKRFVNRLGGDLGG